MKRFLLLAFVLALTSISRAALIYEITHPLVDGNVTWYVVGTQLVGYGTAPGPYSASLDVVGGCGYDTGTLSLADTDVGAGEGFTLAAALANADDYFPYMVISSQSVGDLTQTVGVPWFVFDINLSIGTCFKIAAANEANNWEYGETVRIGPLDCECPEPITLALLGFGALFLPRRKYAAV